MDILKWYQKGKVFLYKTWYKGHAVIDIPDIRDYRVKGLGRVGTPNEVDLLKKAEKLGLKLPSQGNTNRCTAFAITGARKMLDTIYNGVVPPYSELTQWGYQLLTGASEASGDYQQNALNQAVKNPQGYPFVYARFGRVRNQSNIDEMVKWLARGRVFCTLVYWKTGKWWAKPLVKLSNYAEMKRIGWILNITGKILGAHEIVIYGYKKDEKSPDGSNGLAFMYYEPMQKKNRGKGWISAKDLIKGGLCGNMYIISDLKDKNIVKK